MSYPRNIHPNAWARDLRRRYHIRHDPIDPDSLRGCFPMARVPNEIFVMIFKLCQASDEAGGRVEMQISHVCRRWRSLALGTSGLWSRILLLSRPQSNFEIADIYLERSRNQPLDYFLRFNLPEDETWRIGRSHRQQMLNRFIPFSGRWRSIDMELQPWHGCHILKEMSDEFAPNLQAVSVRLLCFEQENFEGHVFSHDGRVVHLFQKNAPQLYSLKLDNVFYSMIDWRSISKLTSLTLGAYLIGNNILIAAHEFPQILQHLTSLSELTIEGRPVELHQLGPPPPPATLHALRTLRIFMLEQHEPLSPLFISELIRTIRAPLLQHLHLAVHSGRASPDIIDALRTNGAPTYPVLKSLSLDFPIKNQGLARWLIDASPTVETVSLYSSCSTMIMDELIKSYRSPNEMCWSNLRHIILCGWVARKSCLYKLLVTGKQAGTRIAHVTLHVPDDCVVSFPNSLRVALLQQVERLDVKATIDTNTMLMIDYNPFAHM